MKKLYFILILFFSFNLNAGDNLGGKKIVCYEESDENIKLLGFFFKNAEEVQYYIETESTPLRITYGTYKTATSSIEIANIYGPIYKINRKSLRVNYASGSQSLVYAPNECDLTENSILSFFEKKLEKFKEGNKI